MRHQIVQLLNQYNDFSVAQITSSHYEAVHKLWQGNNAYTALFQSHSITLEEVIKEVHARPIKTALYQKCFIGFYLNDTLVAIADLILNYPNEEEGYIGLLMMDRDYQQKGYGKKIYQRIESAFKSVGFKRIELGVVKENKAAFSFWKNRGYQSIRHVTHAFESRLLYVTVMEKMLST